MIMLLMMMAFLVLMMMPMMMRMLGAAMMFLMGLLILIGIAESLMLLVPFMAVIKYDERLGNYRFSHVLESDCKLFLPKLELQIVDDALVADVLLL